MYKRDVKRIRFRFFARMSLRPLNETSSMSSFKQISSKSIDLYSLLLSIRKLESVFYNSKSRCYIFQKLFTKAELCLLFKLSFLKPNCSSILLVFSIKSIYPYDCSISFKKTVDCENPKCLTILRAGTNKSSMTWSAEKYGNEFD